MVFDNFRKEPIGAEMKKLLQDKDVDQLPPRSRVIFYQIEINCGGLFIYFKFALVSNSICSLVALTSFIENVHLLTDLIHVHIVWLNDSRMPRKNCFLFEFGAIYIQ